MNLKIISLIICFLIIYNKYFKDKFYNWFKLENMLKLSINFRIIKPHIKYIKIRDIIKLATFKNNFTASKANNII